MIRCSQPACSRHLLLVASYPYWGTSNTGRQDQISDDSRERLFMLGFDLHDGKSTSMNSIYIAYFVENDDQQVCV